MTYLSGYIYTKYQNIKSKWLKIIIFNLFFFIFGFLFLWKYHGVATLFKWSVIIVIGLLYDSYFLKYFVRQIPLFKIFYVGITWGLMCVWLPFETWHWEAFFIVVLYISALVLPFDIRDKNQDEILTFPKWIGVEKTKILAYILLFISGLLVLWFYGIATETWAFLGAVLVSVGLVAGAAETRRDLYFSFGVETCCGLPFLFLILLKYF